MPLTVTRGIEVVTEYRAYGRSSPLHTGPSFTTSFGIGGHNCAETLAVSTTVTSTRVSNTVVIVRSRIHLIMALVEGGTDDDATMFLGPGCSVDVDCTGISDRRGLRAAR